MKDRFLDSIRKKMDSYEESVPDGLWDEIISSVPVTMKERKRHAVLPWLYRSAAVAAAVAAGIVVGLNIHRNTSQTLIDIVVPEEGLTSQTNPSSSVHSEEVKTSGDDRCAMKSSQTRLGSLVAQAAADDGEVSGRYVPDQPDGTPLDVDETGAGLLDESRPVNSVTESREISGSAKTSDHDGEDWSGRMSASKDYSRTHQGRRVSASLMFTGAMTSSQLESAFDPQTFYRGSAPAQSEKEGDDESENSTQKSSMRRVQGSKIPSITTDAKHYRPVRIAATARWRITDVFGLESGVTWTRLDSRFTTSAAGVTYSEDKQVLQYVGVPLDFSASFLNDRLFSFYVSGGGLVEKCVSGQVRSSEYVSGTKMNTSSSKLSVDPLLWSLNAGAGAQVNFLPSIGLFVEPGISYHFDDGSSVQNIYKEHPLDFMMTFGLRVSFK